MTTGSLAYPFFTHAALANSSASVDVLYDEYSASKLPTAKNKFNAATYNNKRSPLSSDSSCNDYSSRAHARLYLAHYCRPTAWRTLESLQETIFDYQVSFRPRSCGGLRSLGALGWLRACIAAQEPNICSQVAPLDDRYIERLFVSGVQKHVRKFSRTIPSISDSMDIVSQTERC